MMPHQWTGSCVARLVPTQQPGPSCWKKCNCPYTGIPPDGRTRGCCHGCVHFRWESSRMFRPDCGSLPPASGVRKSPSRPPLQGPVRRPGGTVPSMQSVRFWWMFVRTRRTVQRHPRKCVPRCLGLVATSTAGDWERTGNRHLSRLLLPSGTLPVPTRSARTRLPTIPCPAE